MRFYETKRLLFLVVVFIASAISLIYLGIEAVTVPELPGASAPGFFFVWM
jgi:hypothetical protein